MSSVPVLYHAEGSYYSQLVRFCLAEKGIKYKSHLISLATGEMHEAWYMKTVNPKGMVPALEHHGQYYTDSKDIIEYVATLPAKNMYADITSGKWNDTGVSSIEEPRLFPDEPFRLSEYVRHFRDRLASINVKVVTYGSLYHRHLTINNQFPSFLTRDRVRQRIESFGKNLIRIQNEHPDLKAGIKERRGLFEEAEVIFDEEAVIAVLDDVDKIMAEVENELQKREEEFGENEYWLCGNIFTVADIYLSCLIHRLTFLGHAQRFYLFKRPLVTKYYQRVQLRPAFRTACGFANSMFWSLLLPLIRAHVKKASPIIACTAAVCIGIFVLNRREQFAELASLLFTKFS